MIILDSILLYYRLRAISSSALLGSSVVLPRVKDNELDCTRCHLAKLVALPFHSSENKTKALFDLVHSQKRGPAPVLSKAGSLYVVTFIDDFSRFTWICFLRLKSSVLNICFVLPKDG